MNNEEKGTTEIDLLQIASALIKRWWIILVASVVCAVSAFGYTYLKITPLYQASALLYVNNSSVSLNDITVSDLTASKSLVDSYSVILKSRLTLEEVIKKAHLNYSYETLYSMVSAQSVNKTEIFSVSVKSSDPDEARIIANTIVEILPAKISEIIKGSSVSIVDLAVTPKSSYYPSYSKNSIIGFLVGFIVSAAAVIILEVFVNDRIQSEDWLRSNFGENIPVLSVIPDISSEKNGKSYGGYKSYKSYRSYPSTDNKRGTEKKN